MKKIVVVALAISLMVTLISVTPARADRFWPGVAVGVGSAILLGQLIHPPRDYYAPRGHYYPSPPVRVYSSSPYYCPPPPVYRERWIPGHWVENYGPYGEYSRYWVAGHLERY
ncbi:MAG: hypothetical protein C0407_15755 [Desulfobacca sp.]|nr:hypothetical protein [Desulfobacca sp.]